MEDWTTQELTVWMAAKGFEKYTTYLKEDNIDGEMFISLTTEDLVLKYEIDKTTAKRIILKRDKTNSVAGGGHGSNTLRRITRNLSLRKEKKTHTRLEESTSPRRLISKSSDETCNTDNGNNNTNTPTNTTNDGPTQEVPHIEKKPALTVHHVHAHSTSSSFLTMAASNNIITKFGGSGGSEKKDKDREKEIKDRDRDKEKEKENPVEKRAKSPKLKNVIESATSPLKLSNGVEDPSAQKEVRRVVKEVGTPFNISHNVHVEFNKDLGYIGLPVEWKTFLEENAAMGLNSRRRDKPAGSKVMRSFRYSHGVKKIGILQWELKNVLEWLEVIGFSVYKENFEKFECNGTKLMGIIGEDLVNMGISNEKHVELIIKQITLLKTPVKSFHTNPNQLRRRSKSIDSVMYENWDSDDENPEKEDTTIFGVPLETLLDRQREKYPDLVVPVLADQMIKYIKEKGLKEHGIFRISPSLAKIQEIRDKINNGENVNMDEIADCHLVAALLKQFLRELPAPLIPQQIFSLCILALNKDLSLIKEALRKVPEANYAFLYSVLTLLQLVAQNDKENLMNAENLSRVFGPTILWQNTILEGLLDPLGPIQQANDLVLTFITSFSVLFSPPSPRPSTDKRPIKPDAHRPALPPPVKLLPKPPPGRPLSADLPRSPDLINMRKMISIAEVPKSKSMSAPSTPVRRPTGAVPVFPMAIVGGKKLAPVVEEEGLPPPPPPPPDDVETNGGLPLPPPPPPPDEAEANGQQAANEEICAQEFDQGNQYLSHTQEISQPTDILEQPQHEQQESEPELGAELGGELGTELGDELELASELVMSAGSVESEVNNGVSPPMSPPPETPTTLPRSPSSKGVEEVKKLYRRSKSLGSIPFIPIVAEAPIPPQKPKKGLKGFTHRLMKKL